MDSRKSGYDAVVVGGGIVGTSIAYHLIEAGADTLLIDRGDAGQVTAAGAGIVAPLTAERLTRHAADSASSEEDARIRDLDARFARLEALMEARDSGG